MVNNKVKMDILRYVVLQISVIIPFLGNDTYFDLGYSEGFAQKTDSISIIYNYHKHSGSSTSMGGCYTVGYHIHTGSCTSTCTVEAECIASTRGERGNYYNEYIYRHKNCGQGTVTGSDWQNHSRKGQTWTSNHTYSSCTGKINAYKLGCGKTEESIESATLIYN